MMDCIIKSRRQTRLVVAACPTRSPRPCRGTLSLTTLLALFMMMMILLVAVVVDKAGAFVVASSACVRQTKCHKVGVCRMAEETSSEEHVVTTTTSKLRGETTKGSSNNNNNNPIAATNSKKRTHSPKYFHKNSKQRYNNKDGRPNYSSGGRGGRRDNILFQNQKRLNRQLVQSETADELLTALQQESGALTKHGGGGVLNTVNFSTALHRLARHSLRGRTRVLTDPRVALLTAGLAELLATTTAETTFSSRELSNISWALAKLRIAPPSSALPLKSSSEQPQQEKQSLAMSSSNDDWNEKIQSTAKDLRLAIVQASKDKQPGQALQPTWIPQLSTLAGYLVDEIALIVSSRQDLTQQEMANLIWSWATVHRADATLVNRLLQRMMDQKVEERKPQEWSNVVWALATAKVYQGYDQVLEFLANCMQRDETFVAKFKPQEISNTIWGMATLLSNMPDGEIPEETGQTVLRICRLFVPHVVLKADIFKTQELSNTLWGLATLNFGNREDSVELRMNGYIVLPSPTPESDTRLKDQAVEAIVAASGEKLRLFKSQELNNLAWGLARLLDPDTESIHPCMRSIGVELCNPKRRRESQDIGTTIWAMATLGYFDDDLYRMIISTFDRETIVSSNPQELCNTLWAVATAEIDLEIEKDAFDTTLLPDEARPYPQDPITIFIGHAALQLIRRPSDFKAQEIKSFVWGLSKLGIRYPDVFRRTAEYLVGSEDDNFASARGLEDFNPQGLGNLAWAFARQAQLAEEVAERNKSTCAKAFKSGGKLGAKKASDADIGHRLLERLFSEIAETDLRVHNNLSDLKPQDLSNTVWTLGLLSICHDEFVESAKQQFQKRIKLYLSGQQNSMTLFKGQEISNFLWGLATLNVPTDGLLDDLGGYLKKISRDENGKVSVKGIASVFKRQELANIAWSCAVFGQYPNELITFLYGGLLGNQKNPQSLMRIFGDAGLQNQAIMTLLYVQTAMELSGSSNGLSLPPDFPNNTWHSSSFSKAGDVAPTFELRLSTSKIQRDVSDAFSRIGFDHVEEHVISMENLSSEYGIGIAPKPAEVLSLDIANVQNRIAVEVDGPSHFYTTINDVTTMNSDRNSATKSNQGEFHFLWTGDRQRINGSTALKERMLNSLGWKVIHLPFWEWQDLQTEQEQDDYCRQLLAVD